MTDSQDLPHFARGVAGPLGKLEFDLKTKVDEPTDAQFRRHCALIGMDPSAVLRDCVYAIVYERTYSQILAEKLIHEGHRIQAITALIGHIGAPNSEAPQ